MESNLTNNRKMEPSYRNIIKSESDLFLGMVTHTRNVSSAFNPSRE